MWLTFLTTLLNIIDLVLPLLIAVPYFTLAERKIMGQVFKDVRVQMLLVI